MKGPVRQAIYIDALSCVYNDLKCKQDKIFGVDLFIFAHVFEYPTNQLFPHIVIWS